MFDLFINYNIVLICFRIMIESQCSLAIKGLYNRVSNSQDKLRFEVESL